MSGPCRASGESEACPSLGQYTLSVPELLQRSALGEKDTVDLECHKSLSNLSQQRESDVNVRPVDAFDLVLSTRISSAGLRCILTINRLD
jgi:hypothetical protein